ncbi:MAG: serine/threonine protein phosphatase, partial [Oscillospiraceae bacterium]
LHNNSYEQSYYNICGTRGWMIENESDFNKKIISRETSRLITSLESAKNNNLEKIVFFHYPPIFNHNEIKEFTDVLKQYNIKRCYYGHVHGKSQKFAPNGTFDGIHYQLVSCDYTEFKPIAIG